MALHSTRRPHLAAIPPNIIKIVKTHDGAPLTVRYALQNPSPRRVRAQLHQQNALKMRFHISTRSINQSWVNCDQVAFWFQIPK
jgi:hypothetical protein